MNNAMESIGSYIAKTVELLLLILGPLLICFASVIIGGLSWTFFVIYLPMMQFDLNQKDASLLLKYVEIGGYVGIVIFLLIEIIFNYFMAVTTRNTGHSSSYDIVVRELAESINMEYPKTPQEVDRFQRDFKDKISIRVRRRQAREVEERERLSNPSSTYDGTASGAMGTTPLLSTMVHVEDLAPANSSGGNTTTGDNVTLRKNTRQQKPTNKNRNRSGRTTPNPPTRSWMLMASDEWGYCSKTNQPKPPRSHYDHVSKSLVLNFDHYCPWMFNAIGYFNYRYFVNFLIFVCIAMIYVVFLTYRPFVNSTGLLYREQLVHFRKTGVLTRIHPYTPLKSERMPLNLCFMLGLAIGIAVGCLASFHLFLVFTGQTTIEFHGNYFKKRKAKRLGKKYRRPYDMGWKRNWQQVYGEYDDKWSMFMAVLIPSGRDPEFLPLPIEGELGKRKHMRQEGREEEDKLTKSFILTQPIKQATIV